MSNDWKAYREQLHKGVGEFAALNPDAMRGLGTISGAAAKGVLGPKVHELIALAVAVTTRCDGCIVTHTKLAAEHGATREEIAEAMGTAIALNAGAALTYTARVLDAFDAQANA
ncbi:MAG: carboxymuconolactone decarboxylase family protein [Luteibacter sp.]|uniref:carboxymuconolactone decarboxylase family protein n=1 Tax=Luteibacter sp. TaxID=1886636 RepID=UPI0028089083|nr:carboxymuconolactone decarboxylase family protein [Luteibacter sp.]MDQ7995248.1 carboxymuconolactone decarboxylase family protein [Luteibacter sp.]